MQKELHFLMKKDIFVIESLERLGRSYDEILYSAATGLKGYRTDCFEHAYPQPMRTFDEIMF